MPSGIVQLLMWLTLTSTEKPSLHTQSLSDVPIRVVSDAGAFPLTEDLRAAL